MTPVDDALRELLDAAHRYQATLTNPARARDVVAAEEYLLEAAIRWAETAAEDRP